MRTVPASSRQSSTLSAALLAATSATLCIGCRPTPDIPIRTEDAGAEPRYVPSADGGREIVLPEPEGTLPVAIGVPDDATGIQFAELVPGGSVPFGGVGQTGLTARVGLRVGEAGGEPLPNAIVQVDITRVDDASIRPAMNRLRDSATNLRCDESGVCIYVPLHLQILHLNSAFLLEGTVVTIKVRVVDPADTTRFGTVWSWGVLEKLE